MYNKLNVDHHGHQIGNNDLLDQLYHIELEKAKEHDAWMTEQLILMELSEIGSEDNLKRIF